MQGLKKSDAIAGRSRIDVDEQSITGQFRALHAPDGIVVNEAIRLPDDRRNRTERRRTRNPVFEARARRVGMALDRRQRRGWVATLRGRCKVALRSLRTLRMGRDHDLAGVTLSSAPSSVLPQSSSQSSTMAVQSSQNGS